MNGKILLDTNIVIAIFAEENFIIDQLNSYSEIFVPVTVVGELYFGAYKSNFDKNNLHKIDQFVSAVTILDCNKETAIYYGQIKRQLKKKGTPIPENDIWIAAMAKQYNLLLFTKDQHFQKITGLPLKK